MSYCNWDNIVAIGPATDCTNALQPNVEFSLVEGTGYLVGSKRAYYCIGYYPWTNGYPGNKLSICQADGTWSSISLSCPSIFFNLD